MARYDGGAVDFLVVLDSQRSYLQARRYLVSSEGNMAAGYVLVNRCAGLAQPVVSFIWVAL